jgi:hypothetical protein
VIQQKIKTAITDRLFVPSAPYHGFFKDLEPIKISKVAVRRRRKFNIVVYPKLKVDRDDWPEAKLIIVGRSQGETGSFACPLLRADVP